MKIISKFINKQFLDKHLKDAFYDNGILFADFYILGEVAKKLKKYDDIRHIYVWSTGIETSFHSEGMKQSLNDIYEFYNLYEHYKIYIQTEEQKLFKRAMWFIICFNAFNQGYELKEFNIKTKRFNDIEAIIEWMLSSPKVFFDKFDSDFKKLVTQLKKLEKDLISFQKRYDKEDKELKDEEKKTQEYYKTDEGKKLKKLRDQKFKKEELQEEKIRQKEYAIEQEALKKKMGITIKGRINRKTLNKAQLKIHDEYLDEMLRSANEWKNRV
jgi:hypothetical protein